MSESSESGLSFEVRTTDYNESSSLSKQKRGLGKQTNYASPSDHSSYSACSLTYQFGNIDSKEAFGISQSHWRNDERSDGSDLDKSHKTHGTSRRKATPNVGRVCTCVSPSFEDIVHDDSDSNDSDRSAGGWSKEIFDRKNHRLGGRGRNSLYLDESKPGKYARRKNDIILDYNEGSSSESESRKFRYGKNRNPNYVRELSKEENQIWNANKNKQNRTDIVPENSRRGSWTSASIDSDKQKKLTVRGSNSHKSVSDNDQESDEQYRNRDVPGKVTTSRRTRMDPITNGRTIYLEDKRTNGFKSNKKDLMISSYKDKEDRNKYQPVRTLKRTSRSNGSHEEILDSKTVCKGKIKQTKGDFFLTGSRETSESDLSNDSNLHRTLTVVKSKGRKAADKQETNEKRSNRSHTARLDESTVCKGKIRHTKGDFFLAWSREEIDSDEGKSSNFDRNLITSQIKERKTRDKGEDKKNRLLRRVRSNSSQREVADHRPEWKGKIKQRKGDFLLASSREAIDSDLSNDSSLHRTLSIIKSKGRNGKDRRNEERRRKELEEQNMGCKKKIKQKKGDFLIAKSGETIASERSASSSPPRVQKVSQSARENNGKMERKNRTYDIKKRNSLSSIESIENNHRKPQPIPNTNSHIILEEKSRKSRSIFLDDKSVKRRDGDKKDIVITSKQGNAKNEPMINRAKTYKAEESIQSERKLDPFKETPRKVECSSAKRQSNGFEISGIEDKTIKTRSTSLDQGFNKPRGNETKRNSTEEQNLEKPDYNPSMIGNKSNLERNDQEKCCSCSQKTNGNSPEYYCPPENVKNPQKLGTSSMEWNNGACSQCPGNCDAVGQSNKQNLDPNDYREFRLYQDNKASRKTKPDVLIKRCVGFNCDGENIGAPYSHKHASTNNPRGSVLPPSSTSRVSQSRGNTPLPGDSASSKYSQNSNQNTTSRKRNRLKMRINRASSGSDRSSSLSLKFLPPETRNGNGSNVKNNFYFQKNRDIPSKRTHSRDHHQIASEDTNRGWFRSRPRKSKSNDENLPQQQKGWGKINSKDIELSPTRSYNSKNSSTKEEFCESEKINSLSSTSTETLVPQNECNPASNCEEQCSCHDRNNLCPIPNNHREVNAELKKLVECIIREEFLKGKEENYKNGTEEVAPINSIYRCCSSEFLIKNCSSGNCCALPYSSSSSNCSVGAYLQPKKGVTCCCIQTPPNQFQNSQQQYPIEPEFRTNEQLGNPYQNQCQNGNMYIPIPPMNVQTTPVYHGQPIPNPGICPPSYMCCCFPNYGFNYGHMPMRSIEPQIPVCNNNATDWCDLTESSMPPHCNSYNRSLLTYYVSQYRQKSFECCAGINAQARPLHNYCSGGSLPFTKKRIGPIPCSKNVNQPNGYEAMYNPSILKQDIEGRENGKPCRRVSFCDENWDL